MPESDPPDDDAGASGTIDVSMSDPRLPRAGAPVLSGGEGPVASGGEGPVDAGESGAIDVRLSDPDLPAIDRRTVDADARRRRGTLPAMVAHAADAIGGTVARAGGAVGDAVGASLSHLPVMPKTRRGRVMWRSVIVSFVLVFGWIAVIVGLQLRGARPPDLRPSAERILIALRDGKAGDVYDAASIRFQGVVRDRQTFVDQMDEMSQTLGPFREITAVTRTETYRGPGGRTSRLDVNLEYGQAMTRGSVSFRWEDRRWRLMGLAIEVPDAIASNKQAREDRIAARPDEIAELKTAVEDVLTHSARDEIEALWQDASPAFQQAITVDDLRQTERDRRATLGPFDRVLDVRKVRLNPGRNSASLVVLLQFEKSTITGNFDFSRSAERWRLVVYKLVMPVLQAQSERARAGTGATKPTDPKQAMPPSLTP